MKKKADTHIVGTILTSSDKLMKLLETAFVC